MTFQTGHKISADYQAKRRLQAVEAKSEFEDDIREPRAVVRFSMADMDKWGDDLLNHLTERWPHLSKASFSGKMRQMIGSNDYLFIRTDGAIGLATRLFEGFDPAPVIIGIFAWPTVTNRREANYHIRSLIWAMERWGREMKAREFRPGEDMMMTQRHIAAILKYPTRELAYRRL